MRAGTVQASAPAPRLMDYAGMFVMTGRVRGMTSHPAPGPEAVAMRSADLLGGVRSSARRVASARVQRALQGAVRGGLLENEIEFPRSNRSDARKVVLACRVPMMMLERLTLMV